MLNLKRVQRKRLAKGTPFFSSTPSSNQSPSSIHLPSNGTSLRSALLTILSRPSLGFAWTITAVSKLVLCLYLVLSKFMVLSLGSTLDLMPKTRPCALVPNRISDRVLGEVEKNSFIALPGKGGHSGLAPLKNCVPQLGRIREEF